MPQLDPAPWFGVLAYSWLVFVTIVLPKTIKFTFSNDPALHSITTPQTQSWAWAWS